MPLDIHSAVFEGFGLCLDTADVLVERAKAHCLKAGMAEADVLSARLAPDMLSFTQQIKLCWLHTRGAVEGIRSGTFTSNRDAPPLTFAALLEGTASARAVLKTVTRQEAESFIGKPFVFYVDETLTIPWAGEEFLLKFSQPNLYFHLATAYGILRHIGVPMTKTDFLPYMQTKV